MPVVPLHLGTFHAYEWVLMMLLIAGPFLMLAGVIVHVRRRDAREAAAQASDEGGETLLGASDLQPQV